MIPILYENTETSFTSGGIGRLTDAIECIVTEERNGTYELVLQYPEDGKHEKDITLNRIIWAKPSVYANEQPFRIYKIQKTLNKVFKVYAQHISYDLAYVSVTPCTGLSAVDAMASMKSHSDGQMSNYSVWSNVSTSSLFAVDVPGSFRSWMGGREGSILDVYGGELEWDRYTVKLWAHRGTDRGLELRYGKNITDIKQETDIAYGVTGITPYMVTAENECLTIPDGSTMWDSIGMDYYPPRAKVMDMSSYVDEQGIREANPTETEEQINARLISAMINATSAYMDKTIKAQTPTIEVSFLDLGSTLEYRGSAALFTQAGLCDTVKVIYPALNISVTSKIIKTEYNVLLNRFEKLTIGKAGTNLATVITDNGVDAANARANARINALIGSLNVNVDDLNDTISRTAQNLENAIDHATELITGQDGGYVVLDQDADGYPTQILIMDTPDKTTATNVWRWNQNGLGFSSTGYSGTYGTAITYDGKIVADYITTGTLSASRISGGILDASVITTGILSDAAGRNWWNMSSGAFSFCNGNMIYDIADGSFIQLQNNLSLRLNGIPLCGKSFQTLLTTTSGSHSDTYIYVQSGTYTKITMGDMNVLASVGAGMYMNYARIRTVLYPYTLYIQADISVTNVPGGTGVISFSIIGGPKIKTQSYSWLGDKLYYPTYVKDSSSGSAEASIGKYFCYAGKCTDSYILNHYFDGQTGVPEYIFVFNRASAKDYIVQMEVPILPEIVETVD